MHIVNLKPGQSVAIGDNIVVTCRVDSRSGRAVLQIEAPRSIPLTRLPAEGRRGLPQEA